MSLISAGSISLDSTFKKNKEDKSYTSLQFSLGTLYPVISKQSRIILVS